jgi:hypothetical protein
MRSPMVALRPNPDNRGADEECPHFEQISLLERAAKMTRTPIHRGVAHTMIAWVVVLQ